jgi:DNA-binding helix-turn-helix protein
MKEGNRIRAIRQQQHLSAEKLAALTGIPSQAIFRYELRPIEKVPVGALERIASALGVCKDALLQETEGFSGMHTPTYSQPIRKTIPVAVTIPLSVNEVFNWLVDCPDPGILRYIGKAALRFASELENPDDDDFRSRA